MSLNPIRNTFDLELAEGEELVHVSRHHWSRWLLVAAAPLALALLAVALIWFRVRGGYFFAPGAEIGGFNDGFNIMLLVLVGVLALVWLPSGQRLRVALLLGAALLLGLAWFRFNGGRVFALDGFASPGMDLVNRVALVFIGLMLLVCAYLWVDWRDDALVLTNRRVVHDHRVLFQRHVQEQVLLEHIEKAQGQSNTYSGYWLDYGTIMVQSSGMGRRIVFPMADSPKAMGDKINAQTKRVQGARATPGYDGLVQRHVLRQQHMAPPQPPIALRAFHKPRVLGWLFYENPEINEDTGVITWRPHWVIALGELVAPVLLLLVGIVLILVALSARFLNAFWVALAGGALALVCLAWAAYRYSDTREDELVLTRENITDREKKPLGPEIRRSADLKAIQNVNYTTSLIGRLLGYGTVVVQTAGKDARLEFEYIPNPRGAVGQIYDYRGRYLAGERERSLNDAISLLRFFHEEREEQGEV
ncbi:MAG: PH domain-containing protein [Chloroflexales bacterium]|nr:PH domain-containing protein [Chloroflexales bacterium]